MIDCRILQEQIDLLAIQPPDVSLPDELCEHLDSCEVCGNDLRETKEAWLLLPAAYLAIEPVNKAMEIALLDRITAETAAGAASAAKPSPYVAIGSYVLAASVLIALLAGTFLAPKFLNSGGDSVNQDVTRIKEFARQMDKLNQLKRVFAAPKLHYVSFESVHLSQHVQGYLVYDLVANEGHFFGFNLPKTNQQVFKLWLLDESGDVISSAIIDISENNLGATVVPLPEDLSILHEATITAESQLDAVRPSSAVHMRTEIAR